MYKLNLSTIVENTIHLPTGNSFIFSEVMKDVFLRMTVRVITVTEKLLTMRIQ